MTEAMYDLLYIIDSLVRIVMMLSIIFMIMYFVKHLKKCAKRTYQSIDFGRIHDEK